MKFIVDANLPPALARWLAAEGHDSFHAFDIGMAEASDRAIWRYAREMDAYIVTKDEDFVLLHALDRAGPAIVWIRIGNAVRRVLVRRLSELWPGIVTAIERGEKIVEVR